MRPLTRRRFVRNALAVSAGALVPAGTLELLGACSPATSSARRTGGHVTEAATSPRSLNPIRDGDVASLLVSQLLFDGLMTSSGSGDPAPCLASSAPAVSADGLTYRFTLRQDATWTDGKPVTAADVVFTYQLMYDPRYRAFPSTRRSDLEQYLADAAAVGDHTVAFTLRQPFAPFLVNFCQYGILPEHVLGGLSAKDLATASFNSAPSVTSGMFRFVRWDADLQIVFERNPIYYRGRVGIDTYVVRFGSLGTSQLETGEVDVAPVAASDYDRLKTAGSVNLRSAPLSGWIGLLFQLDPANPASRIFGDRQVRQALMYALDRTRLLKTVYFGHGQVADSAIPPASWAHNPDVKPRYGFDLGKANQLLDAAGWRPGRAGTRERAGLELRFELLYTPGPSANILVPAVQQMWAAAGADVGLRPQAGPQLIDNILNRRNFDVVLQGYPVGTDPDISRVWSSRAAAPGGLNVMHYLSPEVDGLLDEAAATSDRAKRRPLYNRVQDLLAQDVPAAILFYPPALTGVRRRVVNWGDAAPLVTTRPWMKDVYVTDGV